MSDIRPATAEDAPFLAEMLACAADWRPGTPVRPTAQVLGDPSLAHYVEGFGRNDDFGVVAIDATDERDGERPVGAAWCRCFTADDPGYGFVDAATPEVAIGVRPNDRGRGIGTRLLEALIAESDRRKERALSLSVESDNPAVALYRRLGFVPLVEADGSVTMLRSR